MKKIFILFFLAIFSIRLIAQIVFVSLDNDVYDFLERVEIKVGIDVSSSTKPISRKKIVEILHKISEGENYNSLSKCEKDGLKNQIKKFSYEEKFLNSSKKFNAEKTWKPLEFPYKFYFEDNFLTFNPIFRIRSKINESDSAYFSEDNTRITGGGRIYGYLGDKIGFYFYGVNNAEWGNDHDFNKIDSPEQGIGALVSDKKYYDEVDAYVSFSTKHTDLIIGRFSNYWGCGKTGSLFISDKAPSYPQVMLKAKFSNWLNLTYFHGWLESNIEDSLFTYWGDDEKLRRKFYKKKYIAAHRLEITPLKNLKFGLSELIYYGEREPELVYFIPVMLFWSAQHYTNDRDNYLNGIDFEWIPINFCKIYGSLMIDEMKLSKIFDANESHNYVGFQIGSYFVEPIFKDLDFRIEYTRLNPWTYTHKFPINEATSDGYKFDDEIYGYTMGYWTGQNSDNFYFGIDYHLNQKTKISFDYSRYRKGAQDSIKYQYTIPPAEKFLYGHQYTKNKFGFSLEFGPLNNLFCKIGYEYLDCNVIEKNIEKALDEEYINPIYYKYDFTQNKLHFSIGYNLR